MLTDAHNHAHELATPNELAPCVVNGTSPADWDAVAQLAEANPELVVASFGLHPWFIDGVAAAWAEELRARLEADPSAAVGECGLDKTGRSPALDVQEQVFREQVRIAREFDRPVSVHCVRAWGRLADVLRSGPLPARGVMLHSFAAPVEMAREFIAIDGISFSLCFADRVAPDADVVRALPGDRVLVESDASAENGRKPADVVAGYKQLAAVLGEPVEEIAARVRANFDRLFRPVGS